MKAGAVGHPVHPEPASEPDTVFEPRDDTVSSADVEGRRRVVNLASHTSVGVAAGAAVLGVQRLQETGNEDVSESAGLDVFEDAGDDPAARLAGGMSASAEPVDVDPEPVEPAGTDVVSLANDALPGPEPEKVHPADVPAAVEFLPVAAVAEPDSGPDILADFSTSDVVGDASGDHHDDSAESFEPEDVPARESERMSSLAHAGNEIGGGLVLDDMAASDPVFGASSEVGRLVDDEPEEDDDESFASLP
jgi:hypothetical protein